MNAQIQNWDNFCRYHTGDWHGSWTIYYGNGELTDSFKCVRSLHANFDSSEINHQNYRIHADGRREPTLVKTYNKPNTKALYLNNSFSWGFTTLEPGSPVFFETGFRHGDRRASAVVVYDENSNFKQVIIISEHLGSFAEEPIHPLVNELSCKWIGTLTKIMPDWIVPPAVASSWKQLKELGEDYLAQLYPDGVSVSSPRHLESGHEFVFAVDWLVNPTLLYRGTRHFNASGFTSFTLQTFTPAI